VILKNFGLYISYSALALYLAKEFIGWVWWNNWEDDEDEPFPAPILWAFWILTRIFEEKTLRIRCRCESLKWRLRERLMKFLNPRWNGEQTLESPMDADGRTPEEWLVIKLVGVWKVRSWYGDEYDWEIRKNWEEVLNARERPVRDGNDPEPEDAP
jgi:hypothetical protein